MASLSACAAYQAYKALATRPEKGVEGFGFARDENDNDALKIEIGELFCRYIDDENDMCSYKKKFADTAALRKHVLNIHAVAIDRNNAGGKPSNMDVNNAQKFYKRFMKKVEAGFEEEAAEAAEAAEEAAKDEFPAKDLGPLPVIGKGKRKGMVDSKNMRKKVADEGYEIPCESCLDADKCCKQKGKDFCLYFTWFDLPDGF